MYIHSILERVSLMLFQVLHVYIQMQTTYSRCLLYYTIPRITEADAYCYMALCTLKKPGNAHSLTPTPHRCLHNPLPGHAVCLGHPSLLPGAAPGSESEKGSRPHLAQTPPQLHRSRVSLGGGHSLHLPLLQRHHCLGHLLLLQLLPRAPAVGQV